MRNHSSGSFRPPAHVLLSRAATMRASPTASEALLWQQLRAKQLGVEFRRQFAVARFIADFAAPSRRLLVEVDGGWHTTVARKRADVRRDKVLVGLGWRVLRLEASLVVGEVGLAVLVVRWALALV